MSSINCMPKDANIIWNFEKNFICNIWQVPYVRFLAFSDFIFVSNSLGIKQNIFTIEKIWKNNINIAIDESRKTGNKRWKKCNRSIAWPRTRILFGTSKKLYLQYMTSLLCPIFSFFGFHNSSNKFKFLRHETKRFHNRKNMKK